MNFGPFEDSDCFYIEQSKTYERIKDQVHMVEFLLIRRTENQIPVVWVVEAKSSAPRPDNEINFKEYIRIISEKLTNGLSLGIASILRRHLGTFDEIPDAFRNLDLSRTSFRMVLVINGHKKEWMVPLQDSINRELTSTKKIWGLSPTSVLVINDEMAKRYHLIA
jgi:hypothetical protein